MAAIDATAGEKERGTLEVLLVAPVRRAEVVVGKFLATTLFGLWPRSWRSSASWWAARCCAAVPRRCWATTRCGVVNVMGGQLTVTPLTVGLLVVSSVLMAAMVAALLMSVTLFARSFKEAQTYVAPMSFLLIVPAIALQFKDLIGTGTSPTGSRSTTS
jgi:sodium transport system permease protein